MTAFDIRKLDATTSTNEVLREALVQDSLVHPTVIWAEYQSKGKGQHLKTWDSQSGKNLTFSVFWSFECLKLSNRFSINQACCLAVVDALNYFEVPEVAIKWPNDILSGRMKLAGLLIENNVMSQQINSSIIGIGLNVNQTDFEFLPNASSVALTLGRSLDRNLLLDKILSCLQSRLETIENKSSTSIQSAYESSLYGLGKWHQFIYKGQLQTGKLMNVDAQGVLHLQWDDGQHEAVENSKSLRWQL